MIKMKDIKYEGNPILKKKCAPVKLPLEDEDIKTLQLLLNYIIDSQNEETAQKYALRPAVGLAAPQIGILKRMFSIMAYDEEGKLFVLPVINPVIVEHSEDLIYLNDGEGCISVRRPTEGLTPRYSTITFEAILWNYKRQVFEKTRMNLKGYMSIVFQHEYDHLDGILYVDKMFDELPNAKPLLEETPDEDGDIEIKKPEDGTNE